MAPEHHEANGERRGKDEADWSPKRGPEGRRRNDGDRRKAGAAAVNHRLDHMTHHRLHHKKKRERP